MFSIFLLNVPDKKTISLSCILTNVNSLKRLLSIRFSRFILFFSAISRQYLQPHNPEVKSRLCIQICKELFQELSVTAEAIKHLAHTFEYDPRRHQPPSKDFMRLAGDVAREILKDKIDLYGLR